MQFVKLICFLFGSEGRETEAIYESLRWRTPTHHIHTIYFFTSALSVMNRLFTKNHEPKLKRVGSRIFSSFLLLRYNSVLSILLFFATLLFLRVLICFWSGRISLHRYEADPILNMLRVSWQIVLQYVVRIVLVEAITVE